MITEALPGFGVAVRFDEGRRVVHVSGEVDCCTAPDLDALVGAVLDRPHDEIVLDLRDLKFMDGRGLTVIARTASKLGSSGGRLTVWAPTGPTRRLLDLMDLGARVRIEPAEPEQDDLSDIARAAQIPADHEVVHAALLLVVALAEAAVDGADAVTVSLAPHGPLADVVAVDHQIAVLDRDQYALGEGPCLDAAEHADRFHIAATAHEHRWPAFVPRARARGINSILSTPLRGATRAVGALNMYSFSEHGFSEHDRETASLLALGAADVLERGGSTISTAAVESRMRDAVAIRHRIALAQGILIARDGLSADGAYAALRQRSVETSQPLRDVASAVVASAGGGASDDPLAR